MMERSPLQYLSKTFTRSSKVTLPNIRKGLVKVTFPSHLQYLNGSISKSLRSLKVYFRAVPLTVVANLTSAEVTLDTDGHDCSFKGSVSSVSLNSFGSKIRHGFQTNFVTLTNDVPLKIPVANLTSAYFTAPLKDQSRPSP